MMTTVLAFDQENRGSIPDIVKIYLFGFVLLNIVNLQRPQVDPSVTNWVAACLVITTKL